MKPASAVRNFRTSTGRQLRRVLSNHSFQDWVQLVPGLGPAYDGYAHAVGVTSGRNPRVWNTVSAIELVKGRLRYKNRRCLNDQIQSITHEHTLPKDREGVRISSEEIIGGLDRQNGSRIRFFL